jgi:hypothetical protein
VAKAAERNTKGAMILKIWGPHLVDKRGKKLGKIRAHEEGGHQKRVEYRDQPIHRL